LQNPVLIDCFEVRGGLTGLEFLSFGHMGAKRG
jgi:hypothetical protein